MPSVAPSYLRDNFTDNVQAPAWSGSFALGSATKAETGGQAVLTLPSSTAGSHSAYYRTSGTYNLTSSEFYINIGTMVATGVAATATFDMYDTVDPTNILRWQQLSNTITARKVVAGVDTQLYTAAWSSSTYKYLRISESAGTITFSSSTNGTSWTSRATIVGVPFGITVLAIQFGASCGNVASPGSLRLDDVNLILPALSSAWNDTSVEWMLPYRFRSITLGATSGQGYIATASACTRKADGTPDVLTSPRYFAGPIGSASGGYNQLTEYATQAAAQAMAVTLPATDRWDLSTIVECSIIRLYHRSTTGGVYGLTEYYPRRLVQSDDIEAESIMAINIAAHQITADHIATINLDATARITAGGGRIRLDDQGASMTAEPAFTYNPQSAYTWYREDGIERVGQLWAGESATTNRIFVEAQSDGTRSGVLMLAGQGSSLGANDALVSVSGGRAGVGPQVNISAPTSTGNIILAASDVSISGGVSGGGLNVGTATGAGTGQISTSGSVGVGVAVAGNVRLYAKGQDSTSSNYALIAANSGGTSMMYVRNDSVGFLNNTAWTYSSDATKKRNIRPMNKDIVDFMRLDPVRFDYIDGPVNRAGYIAQDVQLIYPDIVETMEDGTLGMRTDELLPLFNVVLRRLIRVLLQKNVIGLADIA